MAMAKGGPPRDPPPEKGELEPPDGLTDSQRALWDELVQAPHVTTRDTQLLLDCMRHVAVRDRFQKILDTPGVSAEDSDRAYRVLLQADNHLLRLRRALKASPQARHQASGGKLKPAVNRSQQGQNSAKPEDEDIPMDA